MGLYNLKKIFRDIYLGKMFDIPVYLNWSFFLLFIVNTITNIFSDYTWVQIIYENVFLLTIFACVVLHEFGHALVARRFGIQTKNITTYIIGGVARLEKIPYNPREELWITIAGPLVNIAIFLLLLPFILLIDLPENNVYINYKTFLPILGLSNLFIALFNLLPIFPLDGGRLLRALLQIKLGRLRATNIASVIGRGGAIGFIVLAFFGDPQLAMVGIFVFIAAYAENKYVKEQESKNNFTQLTEKQQEFKRFMDQFDAVIQNKK